MRRPAVIKLCIHLRSLLVLVGVALLGTAVAGCASNAAAPPSQFDVLVFSKTEGYRHASIPDGIEALREMGREHGFGVRATEEATMFRLDTLSAYAAVVFLNTSGDVFDAEQEAALQQYIRAGGGFVGVHVASNTEVEWPWYNRLVGAYFDGHPSVQEASIAVVDTTHSATRMLPDPWVRTDEWYRFRAVQDHIEVLLMLDERSYDLEDTPPMGENHPIAWYHSFEGGRAWYTALGHTKATYDEPLFRAHLLGGIQWAAEASTP